MSLCADFWVRKKNFKFTKIFYNLKITLFFLFECIILESPTKYPETPTKYPFDIPEPVLDSGVETMGSNSTGSDRDEKHQVILSLYKI